MISFLLAPPESLAVFLEATHNYFYPDGNSDAAMVYYKQREWRIAGNIAIRGQALMRAPSDEMIEKLMALDADFYGRRFPTDGITVANVSRHGAPQARLVDNCAVFEGFNGKTALQYARRVIAPNTALAAAREIVAAVPNSPPVAPLESL